MSQHRDCRIFRQPQRLLKKVSIPPPLSAKCTKGVLQDVGVDGGGIQAPRTRLNREDCLRLSIVRRLFSSLPNLCSTASIRKKICTPLLFYGSAGSGLMLSKYFVANRQMVVTRSTNFT